MKPDVSDFDALFSGWFAMDIIRHMHIIDIVALSTVSKSIKNKFEKDSYNRDGTLRHRSIWGLIYNENDKIVTKRDVLRLFQKVVHLPQGHWIVYYSNRESNEIHGPFMALYSDFQKMACGVFKYGVLHGKFKSWWTDGNIKEIGFIKRGEFDGPWERYWSNGQLMEKGSLRRGTIEGSWERFWQNGDPLTTPGSFLPLNRGAYFDFDTFGTPSWFYT